MLSVLVDFANLFLAALLAGAMFAVWLVFNPAGVSANSYVLLQQQAIRTLNTAMPALGAATVVVTTVAAALARRDGTRLGLLMAAVLCFAAAGLITRFQNQPINAVVITWSSDAPPSDWTILRDAWWRWHILRLAAGLGGLTLVIAAVLRRAWAG